MSSLPDPNQPVERVVRNGKTFISLPSKDEAEQLVHRVRRRVSDLPALPQVTNPIAVVVSYELFGFDAEEIAVATKLSVGQINNIRLHEAYGVIKRQIVENITNEARSEVREVFRAKQTNAAEKIVEMIEHPRPNIAMQASKMVLEASGYKMVPDASSGNPMSKGLTVIYVEESKDKSPPMIDMEVDDA